ncbi:MAG: hypothetical protein KC486_26650 [Myxococcales bacterium]|nr:hypothetical protein [Myxococcales bacterium]
MSAPPYTLTRQVDPPPVIRLELMRPLSEAETAALADALEAEVAAAPTTVLVELNALPRYDRRLRQTLLALQRRITAHGGRAVYVADRPRLRGLALWVVHMAEDSQAKIVGNVAAATEWLRISDHRVAAAEEGTLSALGRLTKRRGGGS